MASVTINSAGKFYGAVEVLKGVSVDIEDGAVRGSGRALRAAASRRLLRMIAGLEQITLG